MLRFGWLLLILVGLALSLVGRPVEAARAAGDGPILVLTVQGAITPVVAQYIERGINEAERLEARAIVLRLDTPGGLDGAMRAIIQRTLTSRVPVIAYVSPTGGRAASAGTFIIYAAHLAAMAPSTTIGSASPVSLGQDGQPQAQSEAMTNKVTNDAVSLIRGLAERRGRNADWAEQAVRRAANLTASDALQQRVVEIIANDLDDLLRQADGRSVTLEQGPLTLRTAGVARQEFQPNPAESFLQLITDPTIAYLLLSLGMLGLYFEFSNPGAILPGVVGAIALVVALFALGSLPVNWAGVLLMALAFVMFGLELFAPTHGALMIGGIISFVLGSLLLINSSAEPIFQIAPSAILAVTLSLAAFGVFAVVAIWRDHHRRPTVGGEALVGEVAVVRSALRPRGMVVLGGERWRAISQVGPIDSGQSVRVLAVHGLELVVTPAAAVPDLTGRSE
jgi:membrane-bound serine protease (ClpP class)